MDVLEAALRPAAKLLNRNIHETTPARELCEKLAGSVIAVRVRNSALAAYFIVDDAGVDVVATTEREPDVIISGSLLTLARMNSDTGAAAIRDGSLEVSGNLEIADRFQQLMRFAKPDIEEELSHVVGDVAAHRLGEFARSLGRWGRDARSTMGANVSEYLQEESRDAPSRFEVERFSAAVSALRDDVDRLEARLNRLRR